MPLRYSETLPDTVILPSFRDGVRQHASARNPVLLGNALTGRRPRRSLYRPRELPDLTLGPPPGFRSPFPRMTGWGNNVVVAWRIWHSIPVLRVGLEG